MRIKSHILSRRSADTQRSTFRTSTFASSLTRHPLMAFVLIFSLAPSRLAAILKTEISRIHCSCRRPTLIPSAPFWD